MKIVLIGAGRLATCLGPALLRAGHTLMQVYSRTQASAQTLALRLGCPWTTAPEEVMQGADLYILAVKDGALEALIPSVARGREEALFVHTAGSMPLSVFEGSGCRRYGVFYPMQTFSKERETDFRTLPIFVEGNGGETEDTLRSLAATLSDSVYVLSSEGRKSLHLAAVFACNFVNHCYARSARILAERGIPFEVMLPLIDETAAKVHSLSPREAQTGPAIRYDRNVLARHLDMLQTDGDAAAEYELLSRGIHRLAAAEEYFEQKKSRNG